MDPTDEALIRLNRAYINSLTEEFVRIVMVAHRPSFDQGVAHARHVQRPVSVPIPELDNSFEIQYRPDGLIWQFLVTPEHDHLFELSHMDRWFLYRLEGTTWRAVSADGGPLPDMSLHDLKLAAIDVRRLLGDYLRVHHLPLPHDSGFLTQQQA
ncbi:hypothetical protein [Lentzea sp. NBRC 102530]|uniref:hypothetical protein n=1 Tax=Lentzea sp. NBRC 102530 TaxID=3032201 RepID=UPI0024A49BF5|nr:hypothetical protein [Lentzea sp. NBRC 102530]GLY50578.1 hypothetical protein Lesp01_42340 [Lentzea sp. NBRC 102530]